MGQSFYMKVKGDKSGVLVGESKKPGRRDWTEISGFETSVMAPLAASIRRNHKPIVITKSIGATSPLLYQMSITGEALQIVIEGTQQGSEKVVSRVTLTNAEITGVTQWNPRLVKYTISYDNIQTSGLVVPWPPK
jgi:type VI secretion system Hcp family effector